MTKIPCTLENIQDWREIVKKKSILLDTDAIISIIQFGGEEEIMKSFKELDCNLLIINPTEIELKRTDSGDQRVKRESFLVENEIVNYPFWQKGIMENINLIRLYLINHKKFPSPTDLYLAAVISKLSSTNTTYLLTGNTTEFPLPLFKREAFLILQNKFSYKVLCFLSVDQKELKKFEEQTPK